MSGKRYDDPKASPEYIARERHRKRLANRRAWVEKWVPRVEAEVKGQHDEGEDDAAGQL